jgi:uncharacterized protein
LSFSQGQLGAKFSFMEGQFRTLLQQKLVDSVTTALPQFTPRSIYLPQIANKALAVIGMRRSGKTTFLWQMIAEKLAAGATRNSLLYFNFEDERLAGLQSSQLHLLVEEFYKLYPDLRDRQRCTFFLDEIQVIEGWETFARRLLDTEKIDLVISGSSARMLSREVASSMRGRAMEALVHPCSFREYLRFLGREPVGNARLNKAARSNIEKDLLTYLQNGGFPEALQANPRDRLNLLTGYVDSTLLRDIIERHEVSHPTALRWMTQQLLSNPAGSFSINKFSNDLRAQQIAIGKDTLHSFLDYLEDSFLIRTLSVFSKSARQRMVNPRKAYPVDTGLIAIFNPLRHFSLGAALETAVLLELERRGAQVHYARTKNGYEVDFFVQYPSGDSEFIQVCADLDAATTRAREYRALSDTDTPHKGARRRLISLNPEAPNDVPPKILWQAASEWLLELSSPQPR